MSLSSSSLLLLLPVVRFIFIITSIRVFTYYVYYTVMISLWLGGGCHAEYTDDNSINHFYYLLLLLLLVDVK